MSVAVTTLGYALLGLIRAEPRSGYALRMVFETTPMGSYSSSPGSIYPALKGLERQGLIVSEAAGARRKILTVTPVGAQVFESWLRMPVTVEELSRSTGDALLRFAFLHDYPQRQVTLDFLTSFESAAMAQVSGLKLFLAGDGANMPLQARLAVLHGLRTMEASAHWASVAREALIYGEIS